MKLLILMGLTGVGKSTAVGALRDVTPPYTLLPNRRALTDELIIPEMHGDPVEPVTDRLARFELTRRYRETYPGGMVHALGDYLAANTPADSAALVFDNLRGLDEAQAATEVFPEARFILLDAPPIVRLQRLIGRSDSFDRVALEANAESTLRERLAELKGLETVFVMDEVLGLEAQNIPAEAILKGVRIILGEAKNYDMGAAASYLRQVRDGDAFLHLDTAALPREGVREQIRAWL